MSYRRRYRDAGVDRAYRAYVDSFRSGARGWVAPLQHGLWREDGAEFRGASSHSAFWQGYHARDPGGWHASPLVKRRDRYVRGSVCYAAFWAGIDCRREADGLQQRHDGATRRTT